MDPTPTDGRFDDLLLEALDAAVAEGASYADVRGVTSHSESITVRGPVAETIERGESSGLGVRVLAEGAWGYAASASMEDRSEAAAVARVAVEIARASATARTTPVGLVPEPAHVAEWATAVGRDPFGVPIEEDRGSGRRTPWLPFRRTRTPKL